MPCCYWNLYTYFNQRCIDVQVKSTRMSLDAIKRRVQAASKSNKAGEAAGLAGDSRSPALIKVTQRS